MGGGGALQFYFVHGARGWPLQQVTFETLASKGLHARDVSGAQERETREGRVECVLLVGLRQSRGPGVGRTPTRAFSPCEEQHGCGRSVDGDELRRLMSQPVRQPPA